MRKAGDEEGILFCGIIADLDLVEEGEG